MAQLVKGGIAWRLASLAIVFGMLLSVVCSGCGGGGGSTTPSSVVVQRYAILNITHELAAKAVADEVSYFVISLFNSDGEALVADYRCPKAKFVTLRAPVESASIRIAYLDAKEQLLGIYAQALSLENNEVFEINDPELQTPAEQTFLTKIEVTPQKISIKKNEVGTFTAIGYFAAGGENFVQTLNQVATWSAYSDVIANHVGNGSFRGAAGGSTKISVSYLGKNAIADFLVNEPLLQEFYIDGANVEPHQLLPLGYNYKDKYVNYGCLLYRSVIGIRTDGLKVNLTADCEDSLVISDKSVASFEVFSDGGGGVIEVTPLKVGTATLTASYTDANGMEYSSTLYIEVKDEMLEGFRPTCDEITCPLGDHISTSITGIFASGFFPVDQLFSVAKEHGDTYFKKTIGPSLDFISQSVTPENKPETITLTCQARYKELPWQTVDGENDPEKKEVHTVKATVLPAVIRSLSITPDNTTVKLGEEFSFICKAHYSSGLSEDFTNKVTWETISPDKLEQVDGETGVFRSIGYGQGIVRALYGTIEPGVATVTVVQE